ncbi:hypothetical protein D3C71_1225320 [compost metagenome]
MKKDIDRSHQQTFDQGRLRAMEVALVTFLRMQQDVPLQLFKEVLATNADTWEETTLDMAVTDEYRNGMRFGSQALLSQL